MTDQYSIHLTDLSGNTFQIKLRNIFSVGAVTKTSLTSFPVNTLRPDSEIVTTVGFITGDGQAVINTTHDYEKLVDTLKQYRPKIWGEL